MEKLKSWGVGLDDSVIYASDLDCPNCDWSTLTYIHEHLGKDTWHRFIVGFSEDCPTSRRESFGLTDDIFLGAIIIECPQCFSKFWFHLTQRGLEHCKTWCPKWPGYTPLS